MMSIVIPAHNEEGNIAALIESLMELRDKQKWECEVIIVDDNSTDNTGKIADRFATQYKNINVIHRKEGNNGMGHALIEGTRKAMGDIVIWTMADLSDNLDTIHELVKNLRLYDIVFCSRYIKNGSRGDLGLDKAILSSGYTTMARLVFGIKVHDITNAFRGFRKEVFNKVVLEAGDFAISPEFAIKAHLNGFKLGEVPTTYRNRTAGKTKFSMLKMGIRYISLLKLRFARRGT